MEHAGLLKDALPQVQLLCSLMRVVIGFACRIARPALFHVEHLLSEGWGGGDEVIAPPPHEQVEIAVGTTTWRCEFAAAVGVVTAGAVNERHCEQCHALSTRARCVHGVPAYQLIFGCSFILFHGIFLLTTSTTSTYLNTP
jgi:hypothetical protein